MIKNDFYQYPIPEILDFTSSLTQQDLNITNYCHSIYNNYTLQKFSQNQIDFVRKNSKNHQETIKSLFEIGYSLPFFPDLVENFFKKAVPYGKYNLAWLLNTSISWYLFHAKTRSYKYLNSVLYSLINNTTKESQVYTISMFCFLYKFALLSTDSTQIDDLIDILMFFFSYPFEHPEEASELLELTLRKTFEPNPKILSDESKKILSSIIGWLTTNTVRINPQTMERILEIILPLITNFDSYTLNILRTFIEYANNDVLSRIFSELASHLCDKIEKNESDMFWISKETAVQIQDTFISDGSIAIITKESFKDGLNLENISFPPIIDFPKLETYTEINLLSQALSKCPIYIIPFLSGILFELKNREKSTKYGRILIGMFNFIEILRDNSNTASLILHDGNLIFSPKITVFDGANGYEYLNTIRSKALRLILDETLIANNEKIQGLIDTRDGIQTPPDAKLDLLDIFYTDHMTFPLLFAEINYRLANDIEYLANIIILDSRFIRSIRKALDYYRNANLSELEFQYEIEIARKSLLYLLMSLVSNISTCNIVSSMHIIQHSVLFMLLEIPLRNFALSIFSLIFKNCTIENTFAVLENFEKLFANAVINMKDAKYLELLTDLLTFMTSEYKKKPKLIEMFSNILNKIKEILEKLEPLPSHEKLFTTIIIFLTDIINGVEIPSSILSNLSVAVNSIYGGNPPDSIYSLFIKFIKCDQNADLSPYFVLYAPKVFKNFLQIFIRTKLDQTIEFASSLINFKRENAIKMSNSEIDIYILSLIPQFDDVSVTNKLLQLFKQIALVESPPLVVKHFISLLSPVNGVLNKHHHMLMKTLWEVISATYWLRPFTGVLGHDYQVNCVQEVQTLLSRGFTLCTWINCLLFPSKEVKIFEISYENTTIELILDDENLKIVHKDLSSTNITELEAKVSKNIWTQIYINYEIQQNKVYEISYNINGEEYKENPSYTIEQIPEKVNIKIGSKIENFDGLIEIGTTIFTVLQTRQKISLLKTTPISSYPNGVKVITGYHENPKLESTTNPDKSSFTYSLTKLWKMDLLLPLFSLFDYKLSDGTNWENGQSQTIAIFTKALLTNDSVQRNFSDFKKFDYVAHLVSQYPSNVRNFGFYSLFYSMFLSLSETSIQQHLFDAILCNPNIWNTSDPLDHLKILHHWNVSLFPRCVTFIQKLRPFKKLLNVLTLYYWFESDPSVSIGSPNSKRPRHPDLDVKKCRKEIGFCMIQVANISFSKEDFMEIFDTCQTVVDDTKQVTSLLKLSRQLIEGIDICKKPGFIGIRDVYSILELVSRNNEEISLGIIKLILTFIKNNSLETVFLLNCLDSIILSLPAQILSEKFFNTILRLLDDRIELLGLLFYYGFSHPDSNQLIIDKLSKIKEIERFKKSNIWFVWPILFITKLDKRNKAKMTRIIVSFCKQNLAKLLCDVDVLTRALGEHYDYLKSLVCYEIVLLLLTEEISMTTDQLIQLFNYIFTTIFYRLNKPVSDQLENFGILSPFSDNFKQFSSSKDRINFQGIILTKLFMNIDLQNTKYFFGYRFDERNIWSDLALAQITLELIMKCNAAYYYRHALFMSQMIAKFSKPLVENFVSEIKFPQNDPFVLSIFDEKVTCPMNLIDSEVLNKIVPVTAALSEITNEVKKSFSDVLDISENMIKSMAERQEFSKLTVARNDIAVSNRQKMMKWNQIWSEMTSESCPWSSMVERTEVKWRRDDTACFAFCPVRLKQNKKFNDHMDASKLRDCSTFVPTNTSSNNKEIDDENLKLSKTKIFGFDTRTVINSISNGLFTAQCKLIKPRHSKKGIFTLQQKYIELVFDEFDVTIIPLSDVRFAFFRTMFHKKTAIEIFTHSGTPYFINFIDLPKNISSLHILQKISEISPRNSIIQTSPFLPYFTSLKLTEKWQNGCLSNFEYLMCLNIYSGRSFLDQGQYPIFPLILIDNLSEKLNFSDERIYRDLSKPIGALDPKRLQDIIAEMKERDYMLPTKSYLYSSGPVSRLAICIFLLRMEPFTSLHIRLQSGKFDIADRQMASIEELVKAICHGPNDFRELIPEFYFQPEFLLNMNHFDLGVRKDGVLNDVLLPNWAKSPLEFVYLNRKALESDFVSSKLNDWIDLIWGYKQKGEESVKAFNTFDPTLYDDAWDETNPLYDEEQLKAFLKLIGQIPPQLFKSPHPTKQFPITPKPQTIPFQISLNSEKVVYSHFSNSGFVTFLTNSGSLISVRETVTPDNRIDLVSFSKKELQNTKLVKSLQTGEVTVKSVGFKFILVYSKEQNSLFLIDTESAKLTRIESAHLVVLKIATSNEWFVTCGREGSCHIYNVDQPKTIQFRSQSYRDGITCTAISDTYKVCLVGTRDRAISVISLTNGVTTRIIEVGGVPVKVAVTKDWGFIVCLFSESYNEEDKDDLKGQKISVWTINGMHVKTVTIMFEAVDWTLWISSRGFDYIAFALKNGMIQIAEVFNMDFKLYQSYLKVQNQDLELSGFFYSPVSHSLICIDKQGRVCYTPYTPPSW